MPQSASALVDHHVHINSTVSPQSGNISIVSLNIRSIVKNNVYVARLIEQHKPDIIVLQETWLNSSIEEFVMQGMLVSQGLIVQLGQEEAL